MKIQKETITRIITTIKTWVITTIETRVTTTIETRLLKAYDFSDLVFPSFKKTPNPQDRLAIMSVIQRYLRSDNFQLCNVRAKGEPKNTETDLVFYLETQVELCDTVKKSLVYLARQNISNSSALMTFRIYPVVLDSKITGKLFHIRFKEKK